MFQGISLFFMVRPVADVSRLHFTVKGIFFPAKKLAGSACQDWKGHEDPLCLAFLHRNHFHNPSAPVAICTLAMAVVLLLCSLRRLQVGLCYSSSDSLMLSPLESTKQTGCAAKFSGHSLSTFSESEAVEQWFCFCWMCLGGRCWSGRR